MIATTANDTARRCPLPLALLSARASNDNAQTPTADAARLASNAVHLASRWDAAVDAIGPAQRPNRTTVRAALNHASVAAGHYRSWGLPWGRQRDALVAALVTLAHELLAWCQCAAGDAYDPDVMGPLMLAACEASAACAEAAGELATREQVSRGSRGRR